MGRQARMRALQHVYSVKHMGGTCDCSRCKHPPRLRPHDVIDFDAIRGVNGQEEAERVALQLGKQDARRLLLRAGAGVAALVALAVAVWKWLP